MGVGVLWGVLDVGMARASSRFMAEIYLRDADANRLIDRTQSYESSFRHKGPWVANDLVFKREWVLPEPLRYYVVRDREAGTWFICERFGDVAVPGTLAKTRDAAIKAFYKWVRREIPDDVPIETPSVRPAEQ